MHDRKLYEKILGIEAPWSVKTVELDRERKEVRVTLAVNISKVSPSTGSRKPVSRL